MIYYKGMLGFPSGSAGKESVCSAGDLGSIPGWGRSPGEGKGYPLQYSGLENSMDCIVHGVAKSRTQLSDFHLCCCCCSVGKFCLFETPWNVVHHQAPLSLGFPMQEYWSGLPFPSPGDLPDPGIIPVFPALAGGFCRATREAPCKGMKSFIEWNTKLNNQALVRTLQETGQFQ